MSFASCKQTLFPLQSTYHTIEPCSTACPKRKETYATINQIRFLFVFSLSMYVLYITYVGKTLTCKKANPFPPHPVTFSFMILFCENISGPPGRSEGLRLIIKPSWTQNLVKKYYYWVSWGVDAAVALLWWLGKPRRFCYFTYHNPRVLISPPLHTN